LKQVIEAFSMAIHNKPVVLC